MLAAEAISAAGQAGRTSRLVFWIDSASYAAAVRGVICVGGTFFSVTAPLHDKVRAVIASIPEERWTRITFLRGSEMRTRGRLISDADAAPWPVL